MNKLSLPLLLTGVFVTPVGAEVLAGDGLVLVPFGSSARGHLSPTSHGFLENVHPVVDALIVDDREMAVGARWGASRIRAGADRRRVGHEGCRRDRAGSGVGPVGRR